MSQSKARRGGGSGMLYLLLATLLLCLVDGAYGLGLRLFAKSSSLGYQDALFIIICIAYLALACWALTHRARSAYWLRTKPRWIWGLIAAASLGVLLQWLRLPLSASLFSLFHNLLLYCWPLVLLHALCFPEFWKRTLDFLRVERSPRPAAAFWITPLLWTFALYLTLNWISVEYFGVQVRPLLLLPDPLIVLAVAYLLMSFARTTLLFVPTLALLLAIVQIGNAIKVGFLGGPLGPDDLAAFDELLMIMKGGNLVLVVAPLAALGLLLVVNFKPRKIASPIALLLLATTLAVLHYQPRLILDPLDSAFGNIPWNQEKNFRRRGAVVHFVQEYARRLAEAPQIPDAQQVAATLDALGRGPIATPQVERRNVYVLLLESFWDPTALCASGLRGDALDPRLRELWENGGRSRALSSTAFGGTPNAEYELLCGVPYHSKRIVFTNGVRNSMPCLPALLADQGFQTLALHPNIPDFWNRFNVYPRLGFQRYLAKEAFEFDDLNGDFLSDASLLRQVNAILERETGAPRLVYVLSITGHYDYPLNESLRPPLVSADDPLVQRYANSIRYTSAEVFDYIDALRSRDPEALIVVLGDHLPYLGKSQTPYIASGLLAAQREDYDAQNYYNLSATPLIVINGRDGPQALGDVAMYELPRIVLGLLGAKGDSWMSAFDYPGEDKARPFNDALLLIDPARNLTLCRFGRDEPDCGPALEWLANVDLLATDVALGDQHGLH
ncbi:MAG: LTA synthase family protein [Candidatus Alcyoniella australis]|nr:LTA synthase family protein [Candidatus Alcyoniella australis]